MLVDLRLQRFVIEDCLVGAINPEMRFLARSFPVDGTSLFQAECKSQAFLSSSHGDSQQQRLSDTHAQLPSAFATTPRAPFTPPHLCQRLSGSGTGLHQHAPTHSRQGGRPFVSAQGASDFDAEDSDEMHSACSILHASGRLDSAMSALPEEALGGQTIAGVDVAPLAQVVRFCRCQNCRLCAS
jgi:hypothetical protein